MRTPESIGEEIREYIKWSSTYFLHYHDKEGRTTEGKALFLGGPLDMVVARVEAIVRDERQHQAKLTAELDRMYKAFDAETSAHKAKVDEVANLQEENIRLKNLMGRA